MAANFSDVWLDELRSRNDIVQVVSGYTQLKQKGRKHFGLCPFHSEKTASFSVDEEKQLYYCFGCHAGGNVIHFIMNIEHMGFPEAVEMLAERAGMQMPEDADNRRYEQQNNRRQRIYAANKLAARYYFDMLKADEGSGALGYLAERGMPAGAISRFGLGYSPSKWDSLLKYLLAQGFKEEELIAAGLCLKKERNAFDFFRNRLMFPIIDQRSRVLGFGGRILEGDGPKYMNTSDTPVYNKRAALYGINFYRDFGTSRELILVEGYMDLMAVSTAGYKNVVATLGTALTDAQTRLIRRFADTVYMAYDGDAAGQNAILRGLEFAEKDGLNVRVMVFPDGNDPDDYIRKNGKHAFGQAMGQALTLIEFKMHVLRREYDMENPDERMTYTRKAAQLLKNCSPVEEERYVGVIHEQTGYSKEVIKKEIFQQNTINANTINRKRHNMSDRPEKQANSRVERLVVKLMVEDAGCIGRATGVLNAGDFSDAVAAELFGIIIKKDSMDDITPASILTGIENPETAAGASELFESEDAITADALDDMLARIKQASLMRQMERLKEEATTADRTRKREIGLLLKDIGMEISRLKSGTIGEMRDDS